MADSGMMLQWMLGLLNRKIIVPTDFHEQCQCVRNMLKDDVTGLVDVLTDFAVHSATVDFTIETNYDKLNELFHVWSLELNQAYPTLPIGLKALAQEYFKERWQGSSFPVLKIAEWSKYGTLLLPTKMVFIDGSSIYADDKNASDELRVEGYDYYIGDKFDPPYKIVADKYVVNRPYGRWYDKYPTPYLIKRGIYHN